MNSIAMKISTLAKSVSIVCTILSVAIIYLLYEMNLSLEQERETIQRQTQFRLLGLELEKASELLTHEAQRYTISGDKKHYNAYWREVNQTQTTERAVKNLKELGATAREINFLETAKAHSDALIATEEKAMIAVKNGQLEYARTLMFDANYDSQISTIMNNIKEFQMEVNNRAKNEVGTAKQRAYNLLTLTNTMVAFYILLVLFLLYYVLLQKVTHPLERITKSINAIASGQMDKKIPYIDVNNEIGELARGAQHFKHSLLDNKNLAIDLQAQADVIAEQTTELTLANEELEEFTYRTSHDLRSPITSSVKLLSVAEENIKKGSYDEVPTCVALAKKSLTKLETLISDLLALTEAKNKVEQSQTINVATLVEEALEKLEFMEGIDKLDIQKNLDFDGTLFTKKSRLNLILENLISNAIKYQDPKKHSPYVRISTRIENQRFVLEIEDNGLGIPKEQESKLFVMFERFHPTMAVGTGLGLYMMKKSADILDGEISYHSLEHGSKFRLGIPYVKPQPI